MKMNKKLRNGIIIAAAAGVLCAGGTAAYLTDYDSTVNEFTVGKVDVELKEPGWNPDDNLKLLPTQEITKDPQVKNVGKNDAFVYLEVSVPISSVKTTDEAGNLISQKDTELFTYAANRNWTLLQSARKDSNQIYTYAYNKILKPQETSEALFEKIVFANIVEGQLDDERIDIPVRTYAIQTANTGGTTGSVAEQARTAFQKYINQNKGQAGAVTG